MITFGGANRLGLLKTRSTGRPGCRRRDGCDRCRRGLFLHRIGCRDFRYIDATLEVSSVFNQDAAGFNIAYQLRFFLDINLFDRLDVPLNRSLNDDLPRLQSSLDPGVGSNGQSMFVALHSAFHRAVDSQVFASEDLTLNRYVLAQSSGTAACRWRWIGIKSSGGR